MFTLFTILPRSVILPFICVETKNKIFLNKLNKMWKRNAELIKKDVLKIMEI